MGKFAETLNFSGRLMKPAHRIVEQIFSKAFEKKVIVSPLNDDDLDKKAGIDSKIHFEDSNVIYSLQEKYRTNDKLRFKDFTQELYNAYGTDFQSDGEFLHLFADYYFYGWANESETDFAEYFIMDVKEYKRLVIEVGGLKAIPGAVGRQNEAYGKAFFYTIPLSFLYPAVVRWSKGLDPIFKK